MTTSAQRYHAHHAPTERKAKRQSISSVPVLDPADSDDDVGADGNDDDFEEEVESDGGAVSAAGSSPVPDASPVGGTDTALARARRRRVRHNQQ